MEQQLTVDVVKRDPNEINNHIQVNFEDVLAEPDGTHSFDCVWKVSYTCFTGGKNCCYKLMTALCGICIALYWGCEFAVLTFEMVWCCTPLLRVCTIDLGMQQKFCGTWIQCCLSPLCESCGLFFSRISVKNS